MDEAHKVTAVKEFVAGTSRQNPDAFHAALDAMGKATVRLAEVAIRKIFREEGIG